MALKYNMSLSITIEDMGHGVSSYPSIGALMNFYLALPIISATEEKQGHHEVLHHKKNPLVVKPGVL